MTDAELDALAKGLTKAQRKMLLTGDDHDTTSEEYWQMFSLGIMSDDGQYALSDLGAALHYHLRAQEGSAGGGHD